MSDIKLKKNFVKFLIKSFKDDVLDYLRFFFSLRGWTGCVEWNLELSFVCSEMSNF